ncbi:glutamate-rich protein 1 [Phoenicopterus ruber ruber]
MARLRSRDGQARRRAGRRASAELPAVRGRSGSSEGAARAPGAMALSRKEVFIGKVLKRLYAETSSSSAHTSSREQEAVPRNLGSKSKEKSLDNVQTSSAHASTSTDTPCKSFQGSDDTIVSPRRMYTVNLPPEGYVAVTPDAVSISVSENSNSSADSTEEEYQGQTKRKRIRKKKQKSNLQNSNNLHGEQTESGMQETLVQDNLQLQQIVSPKISKNKKRKMKKKRQKEKKRAAGLVTKTTGVDFTYQPDKNNREEAAGLKDIDEKADSILDFLQATQQIYFADNKSECTDSAVNPATAQELLQYLESRTISSSDVTLLHQLKSLVLLQDIERLKDALKQFQEQSMMPPGAEILRGLRNHGYSSPENDTWVYKIVADSGCRKNRYQLLRHPAAAGGIAAGDVWDQYIQLQHAPADSKEETSLDPLSCLGMRPKKERLMSVVLMSGFSASVTGVEKCLSVVTQAGSLLQQQRWPQATPSIRCWEGTVAPDQSQRCSAEEGKAPAQRLTAEPVALYLPSACPSEGPAQAVGSCLLKEAHRMNLGIHYSKALKFTIRTS